MSITEGVLAGLLACTGAGWAYHKSLYEIQKDQTLKIASRALRALHRRGVKKQRAVDMVCPELRAMFAKDDA